MQKTGNGFALTITKGRIQGFYVSCFVSWFTGPSPKVEHDRSQTKTTTSSSPVRHMVGAANDPHQPLAWRYCFGCSGGDPSNERRVRRSQPAEQDHPANRSGH